MIKDIRNYVPTTGLSGIANYTNATPGILNKVRFRFNVWKSRRMAMKLIQETLQKKECYLGPFKGEFGHLLGHCLPFVSWLHEKGVGVHYCGMELHKPFFVNGQGESIIKEWFPLRDFFKEVSPKGNSTVPPNDVQTEIENFQIIAENSGLPFWNIGDGFFYWFVIRPLLVSEKYVHCYNLEKVYKDSEENSVVIFTRSRHGKYTDNNGGDWDYEAIAKMLSPYFDKVYLTGHPALSKSFNTDGNIELRVSSDNADILKTVANSNLIITQHSGANYLSSYLHKQVLTIYNGEPPIGSMQNTLHFRKYLGNKYPMGVAFSIEDIVEFVEDFLAKRKKNEA